MSFEFDLKQANAEALAYVRKESLDIFNRLHSIAEDVHFAREVHQAYPELPILPNLRCGAWYLDPEIASQEAAYFKSTDGHFGNWSFNLRRPNLHLLPLIAAEGGGLHIASLVCRDLSVLSGSPPSTSVFPTLRPLDKLKYSPIVCVSASKQVGEGVERRSHGFSYVQGSGDDHELWGMGLTPQLFWEHMNTMLTSDREDLPCVVAKVITESKGRVFVGAVPDMPSRFSPTLPNIDGAVSFVVVSANVPASSPDLDAESETTDHVSEEAHVLRLRLAEGKKDQLHFLQHILPVSTRYIKDRLTIGDTICVCCDSGRDASVGIALAAIQLFFDGEGKPVGPGLQAGTPNKESIRTRLQWIIASRPAANPSRVTPKRVNEFLLSSPAFRRR